MKCISKIRNIILLSIATALCLSGCTSRTLVREYQSQAASGVWKSQDTLSRSKGLASELCIANENVIPEDMEAMGGSAGLFDLSARETLYAFDVHEKMYPASITKIMTALVFLESYQGDYTDIVTASSNVLITESGAQVCGYKEGDQVTVDQLLHGLLIYSGNDAAIMLAEYAAGSVEEFVNRMNERAIQLGATHTHFVNPHGLSDEEHYTTAYDLYLIFQKVVQIEKFRAIINAQSYEGEYTLASGETKTVSWSSTNQFLTGERETPEGVTVIGGKTGTTKAAGNCLILYCQDSAGGDYISVVLREESKDGLYTDMTKLLGKINK